MCDYVFESHTTCIRIIGGNGSYKFVILNMVCNVKIPHLKTITYIQRKVCIHMKLSLLNVVLVELFSSAKRDESFIFAEPRALYLRCLCSLECQEWCEGEHMNVSHFIE